MKTAAYILKSKASAAVHTIGPDDTVFDAVRVMAEKEVGALVVTEHGRVSGIVTERDYARKIALLGRASRVTRVREVMSAPVLCVRPEQSADECMALMTERRLRHLPVVRNGELLGLISIGDLVKDIISEQQFIIEQLEHYIAGDRGA